MKAQFSTIVDADRDLVRMSMSGFFEAADVARFVAERHVAHKRLRCRRNQHLTLVDIRDMAVQSQETVAEFQKALHSPGVYSRRIAIVTRTSLSRSQVRRAADGRDISYFDDFAEAERWVLGENRSDV